MSVVESITCSTCAGVGRIDDDNLCPSCFGRGVLPPRGLSILTAKKLFEINDGLDAKLDSIIAEQASQRKDLTAALTQIWNKVKDL